MLSRLSGVVIVALWLAAMTWLVSHDVLPELRALDRPAALDTGRLADPRFAQTQMRIVDAEERAIGAMWSVYHVSRDSIRRDDVVRLERVAAGVPEIRIDGTSLFTSDGALDEFTLLLHAGDVREALKLHGERFPTYFAFQLEMGTLSPRTFKIAAAEADLLVDAFNPFATMPALKVGQSWRVQVFNPLSALLGQRDRFTSMLVQVTGREALATCEGVKTCFVVESDAGRAWVDESGIVWVQDIRPPVGSRLRLIRERFDAEGSLKERMSFPD